MAAVRAVTQELLLLPLFLLPVHEKQRQRAVTIQPISRSSRQIRHEKMVRPLETISQRPLQNRFLSLCGR
jgi:hypothetical protein